jgi:hypothetical protein
MDSIAIRQLVRPFYEVFGQAFQTAWLDGLAAIAIMRSVRKGERATVLHSTIRETLRELCDVCDPFLVMTEEPEGKGLDAIRLTLNDQVVAIRWGRYDQDRNRINRSGSVRSIDMQQQAFLFGDHFDPAGIPTATLAYQIDNDCVEVGVPQWSLSRVALRRERVDSTEFIEEVTAYGSPVRLADIPDPRTADYILTRQLRRSELERMGEQLRSRLA